MIIFIFYASTIDINFKIEEYLLIEVETPICNLGKIDPFVKEQEYISALRVRVYANVNWELRCETEGDFVSEKGSIIPSEVMSLRTKGYQYQTISKTGITLYRGVPTSEFGELLPVDIKIKPSIQYEPGEYNTRLIISVMRLY